MNPAFLGRKPLADGPRADPREEVRSLDRVPTYLPAGRDELLIQLYLLGPVSVRGGKGADLSTVLARPKRFALLAYLTLTTQEGFCSRDTLLALFWPECDQAHARGALRQSIHVLRTMLGRDALHAIGDSGLRIIGERIWCDVLAFEAAVRATDLEGALVLYRGDLLDGFFVSGASEFERWLEDKRAQLRASAIAAALAAAARAESSSEFDRAVYWARRAYYLAPYSEETLRCLLRVLQRAGDHVQAAHTYAEFAQRAKREHDATPGPETQALLRGSTTCSGAEQIAFPAPTRPIPTRAPVVPRLLAPSDARP